MKTEDAVKILDATRTEARSIGKAVSVMVMDPAGIPVVLERIDNAPPMTAVLAEGKAAASALVGRDSAQIQGMSESYPALIPALAARNNGRFVALRGAIVLRRDDAIVGVVAVSGATPEEDEQIARAGAAAIGL